MARLVRAQHVDLHDVVAHVEVNRKPVPDQDAGPGARRQREAVVARDTRRIDRMKRWARRHQVALSSGVTAIVAGGAIAMIAMLKMAVTTNSPPKLGKVMLGVLKKSAAMTPLDCH